MNTMMSNRTGLRIPVRLLSTKLGQLPRSHHGIGSFDLYNAMDLVRQRPFDSSPVSLPTRFFSKEKVKNKYSSTTTIWKQLQSPPNMITLARMASTPLLAYWVVMEEYNLAIWGCSLAAVSDYMDGYLAKHYGWSTVVGTYLDPLADKAFVNTLGVSLWYSGILPTPLVVVWGVKDVVLLSGTAWFLHQKHGSFNIFSTSIAEEPLKVSPSMVAKVNTALQFATLGVGIVTPVVTMSPLILESLCWVTGMTTVGSVLSYTGKSGFDK